MLKRYIRRKATYEDVLDQASTYGTLILMYWSESDDQHRYYTSTASLNMNT
jgi:hypothetical protein